MSPTDSCVLGVCQFTRVFFLVGLVKHYSIEIVRDIQGVTILWIINLKTNWQLWADVVAPIVVEVGVKGSTHIQQKLWYSFNYDTCYCTNTASRVYLDARLNQFVVSILFLCIVKTTLAVHLLSLIWPVSACILHTHRNRLCPVRYAVPSAKLPQTSQLRLHRKCPNLADTLVSKCRSRISHDMVGRCRCFQSTHG